MEDEKKYMVSVRVELSKDQMDPGPRNEIGFIIDRNNQLGAGGYHDRALSVRQAALLIRLPTAGKWLRVAAASHLEA